MDHGDGASDPPPPALDDTPNSSEWTSEEKEVFECALADAASGPAAFFENVAKKLPRKTVEDVKLHYDALACDVEMIEAGNFAVPDYRPAEMVQMQRRNATPIWTEEEHQLFLMGLSKFGNGDWRGISRYYVIKKTPSQVASHAQKFFRRRPTPPFDPPPPKIDLVRSPCDTAAVADVNSAPPPPPKNPF